MAPQQIDPIPVSPEQLSRAAEGQRAVENTINQMHAAAQDILAPAVGAIAENLRLLESHGKQIAARINRVVGYRLAGANKRGTTIAAAVTGPVQAAMDTVAQNSAELYASVPEYSYHAGGPPQNPTPAPMPTSAGIGAITGRAAGQPGVSYWTRGNGFPSSRPLPGPIPPAQIQPQPQPKPVPDWQWYCVVDSATGCAVTTTDDISKPLDPGFYYVGPFPDAYTASISCAPGCIPAGPPVLPPPKPLPPPPSADPCANPVNSAGLPLPPGYTYCQAPVGCESGYLVYPPGSFTPTTLGGLGVPTYGILPDGSIGTIAQDGSLLIGINPRPEDCPPLPAIQPPPSIQPPPIITPPPPIQPPPGIYPPPALPPPEPLPPPTDDCQPCDVWAVNVSVQNLINVTNTATATISADMRRLCQCILGAARMICECFGHRPPGAPPLPVDAGAAQPPEWIPPPVLEPDFEDEDSYLGELERELAPFEAEQGAAVGGSTAAIAIPEQFGD